MFFFLCVSLQSLPDKLSSINVFRGYQGTYFEDDLSPIQFGVLAIVRCPVKGYMRVLNLVLPEPINDMVLSGFIEPFIVENDPNRCQANKPCTIQALKASIQQATRLTEPETVTKVLGNWPH